MRFRSIKQCLRLSRPKIKGMKILKAARPGAWLWNLVLCLLVCAAARLRTRSVLTSCDQSLISIAPSLEMSLETMFSQALERFRVKVFRPRALRSSRIANWLQALASRMNKIGDVYRVRAHLVRCCAMLRKTAKY